jgi:hypothetical protein
MLRVDERLSVPLTEELSLAEVLCIVLELSEAVSLDVNEELSLVAELIVGDPLKDIEALLDEVKEEAKLYEDEALVVILSVTLPVSEMLSVPELLEEGGALRVGEKPSETVAVGLAV